VESGAPDIDEARVNALGKLSEALEAAEEARGRLYGFHRLCGRADLTLGEAAELLRQAGHGELAARIDRDLVGRNVLDGRWSFQIVEEYDDGYFALFKELEAEAREQLAGGRRHVYEALMKDRRRTPGKAGHEMEP
jgi:hypothetical protein